MDESLDRDMPIPLRPVHLMPGVSDILPRIGLPLALWANTQVDADHVRRWIEVAGMGAFFHWVITSADAGARKPHRRFFAYALQKMRLAADEVILVGNQLNTDIAGARSFAIRSVWLSGAAYRSADDAPTDVQPDDTIDTLFELPDLLRRLRNAP